MSNIIIYIDEMLGESYSQLSLDLDCELTDGDTSPGLFYCPYIPMFTSNVNNEIWFKTDE